MANGSSPTPCEMQPIPNNEKGPTFVVNISSHSPLGSAATYSAGLGANTKFIATYLVISKLVQPLLILRRENNVFLLPLVSVAFFVSVAYADTLQYGVLPNKMIFSFISLCMS